MAVKLLSSIMALPVCAITVASGSGVTTTWAALPGVAAACVGVWVDVAARLLGVISLIFVNSSMLSAPRYVLDSCFALGEGGQRILMGEEASATEKFLHVLLGFHTGEADGAALPVEVGFKVADRGFTWSGVKMSLKL